MKLSVEGDAADVAPIMGFWEVGGVVPDHLLDTCSIVRSSPTPLQAQLLPLMLNGKDVVGIAPPVVGHSMVAIFSAAVQIEAQAPLGGECPSPIRVILTPSSEMAHHVSDEANALLAPSAFSATHPDGIGECSAAVWRQRWVMEYVCMCIVS